MILFTTEVTAGCPLAGKRVSAGSSRLSSGPAVAAAPTLCDDKIDGVVLCDGCDAAADEVFEGEADDWRRADPTKETARHGKQVRAGA
jgi:hypothetical protein